MTHSLQPEAPVVTGLGCICAAGACLAEVVRALDAGERRCVPSTRLRTGLERVYPVFEIPGELAEPNDFPLPAEPSRTVRLALAAALEALGQAGLEPAALRGRRVGVCLGTTVGCTLNDEPFYRAYKAGLHPDAAPVRRYLANNPALFLSCAFGFAGPAVTLANACASGSDAIGLARTWLRAGLCDVALAGGADELSRITYLGFAHLLIASEEPCRPFDRRRTGLNLGEGAGVMVLENPEAACRRGAHALAEAAGYGCAADAWHLTAPHPEGRGLRRAIAQALAKANLPPEAIGFVNAHGTATPDNDRVEGAALAEIFPPKTPVVSTKAYTGHTLGAAGGIEAVLTVQALRDQRLPATVGFEEADPECRLAPTTRNTPLAARAALSDSLAFGGGNAALVFRRCD